MENEKINEMSLVAKVEQHARELFVAQPAEYVYHNAKHTESVVAAARKLSNDYSLSERDKDLLEVAAWLHDVKYPEGSEVHEQKACEMAGGFLPELGLSTQDIEFVKSCIGATKMGEEPDGIHQMIMKDADTAHLGKKNMIKYGNILRMEWELTQNKKLSDLEWTKINVEFLENHKYYTTIAKSEWEPEKQKILKRLKKTIEPVKPQVNQENSLEKKKDKTPERRSKGVETMFRVTLRNHIHLSRIADNKANFLLSISAIIISLLLSNLLVNISQGDPLYYPSFYFLAMCLITMILAIAATRPNITKGKFTKEKLLNKQTNILFFGNFHSVPLDDFTWGMEELMKNDELLYHSLTSDLYFLGKVLHKKYTYLRWGFHVFMFGIVSTSIIFLIVSLSQ